MNDFKTIAKTGDDFVNIVFDHVSDDVDNIMIDLFVDGMKMRTFICDGTENSLTVQPLAAGDYWYKVAQISNDGIKNAEGSFTIEGSTTKKASLEDCGYVPQYQYHLRKDLERQIDLNRIRTTSDNDGEITVVWQERNGVYKNIYIGLQPTENSLEIQEEARLDGSECTYTFTDVESTSPIIYIDFLFNGGQNVCCKLTMERSTVALSSGYIHKYSLSRRCFVNDFRGPLRVDTGVACITY